MKTDFKSLTPMSLVFATFFTICFYQNQSGIAVFLFAVFMNLISIWLFRKYEIQTKKADYLYMAGILLLGFLSVITADFKILFLNHIMMILFVIAFYLHRCFAYEGWDIPEYLTKFLSIMFGGITKIASPISDLLKVIRVESETKKTRNAVQAVLIGIVIAVPILFIITGLLSQADAVFGYAVNRLIRNITIPEKLIEITMMLLFGFFLFYCGVTNLFSTFEKHPQKTKRMGEPLIAITFTSLMGLVYFFFSVIQVIYLFAGLNRLPEGYTYSAYAREGFFQLVAVCLFNVMLVVFCFYYYREHYVLKISLTVISSCTYIMTGSSAYRMILYIQEYGLTFLRVFVLWVLALIFLTLTGIVLAIFYERFSLMRYYLICFFVWYLLFGYSHPDCYIAAYNLNYDQIEGNLDVYYLNEMSADAAGSILHKRKELNSKSDLSGEERRFLSTTESYAAQIREEAENMDFRSFNLSIYWADIILSME